MLDAPTTTQSCCFLDRACLIFSRRGRAGQELPWHVRTDFEQKETKVTKGKSRALGCATLDSGAKADRRSPIVAFRSAKGCCCLPMLFQCALSRSERRQ